MHDVLESDSLSNCWLYLIVTGADQIIPFFGLRGSVPGIGYICIALPYKVQRWTSFAGSAMKCQHYF